MFKTVDKSDRRVLRAGWNRDSFKLASKFEIEPNICSERSDTFASIDRIRLYATNHAYDGTRSIVCLPVFQNCGPECRKAYFGYL